MPAWAVLYWLQKQRLFKTAESCRHEIPAYAGMTTSPFLIPFYKHVIPAQAGIFLIEYSDNEIHDIL
jgi:hypothetical protein